MYRIRHAHITAPATPGASTPCTTSRILHPTRWRGITHSLCTLEFEDHRPLYDWLIENLPVPAPPAADRVRAAEPDLHGVEQAQAARARGRGTRLRLGRSAHADPRRRCGGAVTRLRPSASFCERIGVAKTGERRRRGAPGTCGARGSEQAGAAADGCLAIRCASSSKTIRKDSPTNSTSSSIPKMPQPARAGCRSLASSSSSAKTSAENPPKKFFRLAPGREVRLRGAYFITCTGVTKDRRGRGRRAASARTIPPRAAAMRPTAGR